MVEVRIEPVVYLRLHGLDDLSIEFKETLEPNNEYNPNWDKYQLMQDNDTLRCVAMREDGKLIGFASVIMDDDSHDKNKKIAVIHDIFVTADKRGHASKLEGYIEKMVKDLGVTEILGSQRMSFPSTGDFFKMSGFVPKEVLWAKEL